MVEKRIINSGWYVTVLLLVASMVASGCGRCCGGGELSADSVAVEEAEPVIVVDDEALGLRQTEREIDAIVIHCSASGEDYDLPLDSVIAMHRRKGWKDIGYHFYITRDGTIHRGRAVSEVGAHVRYHNHNTIGVCYEGGLRPAKKVKGLEHIVVPEDKKDENYAMFWAYVDSDSLLATAIHGKAYVSADTRTKAQKVALRELIGHLLKIYEGADVLGHRDYSPDVNHDGVISPEERMKECPCYDVREE